MLDSLITSKTRIKLLIRLFLNPDTKGHLRGLADEFNESTNSVRIELNRLQEAGLINANINGNKKEYNANVRHPLFPEINKILIKITGIDEIVNRVVGRLGGLERVYLTGQMANGKDSSLIDLILVGDSIDDNYLNSLIRKSEKLIKRKIRTLQLSEFEFEEWKQQWSQKLFLLWTNDNLNE